MPPNPRHTTFVNATTPMRKIEQQMITAIRNCQSWKSANTEVAVMDDGTSYVYLHGNKIAEVGDDFVQIFDGGWQTVTTKSRLNALCSAFCQRGEGVFQRNFNWFIHQFVGQAGTSPVYVEKPFTNGFVFS